MAELLFKKGIEESLPIESARTDGTFYVTEDTKKIVLGDAVWEDTNKVKEEIYTEVIKDEKVIAAALTKLNENKQNKLIAGSNIVIENDTISVLSDFKINDNYETSEYPDTDNPEVVFTPVEIGQEFGSAINVLEDNLVLLVNEVIKNEETNALAFTYLNDEKVSVDEFNASLESKLDSEVLTSVVSSLDEKINENSENIAVVNKELSDIDETIAQALTELNETVEELSNISESLDNKADKSEIPSLEGYALETYVDEKITNLVNGAPEALNTLDELAAALKDNENIINVLENAITNKADASALTEYSVTSHTHDDLYYTETEIDTKLATKQDVITDLDDIRNSISQNTDDIVLIKEDLNVVDETISNAVTQLNERIDSKADVAHTHEQYLTEENLEGYSVTSHTHNDLYYTETEVDEKLSTKQDVISDLENIRNSMSQNTNDIVSIKEDLDTVDETISNAVTQLNERIDSKADSAHTHEQYLTEASLEGYALETYVDERITNLVSGAPETLDTLDELASALRDNKDIVSVLENAITNKADASALTEYSVTSHTHNDLYYTETEIDDKLLTKQDVITDLEDIRSGVSQNANDIVLIKEDIDIIDETISNAVTQLNENMADKSDISHTHDNYVTITDLDEKGFITDISNLATKEEVNAKADSSALTEYSVTSHTHDEFTTLNSNIDKKVDSTEYNSKVSEIETKIGVDLTNESLSSRLTFVENISTIDSRRKVLWIGTSIPAGDISFDNNGTTQSTTTDLGSNNYPKMVADALGFTLYNNARGSSFVCFYPPEEDGTSNWASASDWTEYQDETWKGFSLAASMEQVEEKFGANGLNCPEWLVNQFKSFSYESLIIPYIDGTLASCDTVVIDHGYNDRSVIISQASWYPGDGETQFALGAGRSWLKTLQDPFEQTLTTESLFQSAWSADESVDSKKHYFSAMIFICKKIWAVNPRIKIIIGNYFTKKSNVFGAEYANDKLGEFVCLANSAIANWLQVKCVNIADQTGIYNRNLPAGNDYSLFCLDGVHPHSDSTGLSNKIIAGIYINQLRGILYI